MNSENYMRMQKEQHHTVKKVAVLQTAGQNPQLGLPYGTPCLISETELQLCGIIEAQGRTV